MHRDILLFIPYYFSLIILPSFPHLQSEYWPDYYSNILLYKFSGVADSKSYVITSQLQSDVYKEFVEDVNTSHLTGFTFAIISIVHLAGGKITEGIHSVLGNSIFIKHNF